MSTPLGSHAQVELERIGAPDEIKFPLIDIVGTFADVENPESNWPIMRNYLDKLLHYGSLSPITNDPDEWESKFTFFGQSSIWQNKRQPDALTKDSTFANYFLISELTGGDTVTLHPTAQLTP